jgi:hypothetical protein
MSVGFGSDVDEDVEVQLNLSELQLSEIRLAFTEVLAFSLKSSFCDISSALSLFIPQLSIDVYAQDGTWVRNK